MIIVKLIGGLGNQMFQYAFGRSLALKNNTNLKIDVLDLQNTTEKKDFTLRNFELNVFNVQTEIASESEIQNFMKSKVMMGKDLTFEQGIRVVDVVGEYYDRTGISNTGLSEWIDSEIKTDKTTVQDLYEFNRALIEKKQAVLRQYHETEQGKAHLEKTRMERAREVVGERRPSMKMELRRMGEYFDRLPDAPAMLSEFAEFVRQFADEQETRQERSCTLVPEFPRCAAGPLPNPRSRADERSLLRIPYLGARASGKPQLL